MFGRGKGEQAQSPTTAPPGSSPGTREGGKGRPTPSRREAEQRNRHPIVAGQALSPTASKAERKAARQARRQALSAERSESRKALITGDERHLPARDRGPARRWARDYVDARRSVGEYFLPVALVVFGMTLAPVPILKLTSIVVLYAMLVFVAADCYLVRRKIKRETTARFGDRAAGAATYGMLRILQFRRTRLPRPQVARGQYPE